MRHIVRVNISGHGYTLRSWPNLNDLREHDLDVVSDGISQSYLSAQMTLDSALRAKLDGWHCCIAHKEPHSPPVMAYGRFFESICEEHGREGVSFIHAVEMDEEARIDNVLLCVAKMLSPDSVKRLSQLVQGLAQTGGELAYRELMRLLTDAFSWPARDRSSLITHRVAPIRAIQHDCGGCTVVAWLAMATSHLETEPPWQIYDKFSQHTGISTISTCQKATSTVRLSDYLREMQDPSTSGRSTSDFVQAAFADDPLPFGASPIRNGSAEDESLHRERSAKEDGEKSTKGASKNAPAEDARPFLKSRSPDPDGSAEDESIRETFAKENAGSPPREASEGASSKDASYSKLWSGTRTGRTPDDSSLRDTPAKGDATRSPQPTSSAIPGGHTPSLSRSSPTGQSPSETEWSLFPLKPDEADRPPRGSSNEPAHEGELIPVITASEIRRSATKHVPRHDVRAEASVPWIWPLTRNLLVFGLGIVVGIIALTLWNAVRSSLPGPIMVGPRADDRIAATMRTPIVVEPASTHFPVHLLPEQAAQIATIKDHLSGLDLPSELGHSAPRHKHAVAAWRQMDHRCEAQLSDDNTIEIQLKLPRYRAADETPPLPGAADALNQDLNKEITNLVQELVEKSFWE